MFRFKIRTIFILVTCVAISLSLAISAWNEGTRHERLRTALEENQAHVTMTHSKRISTLPLIVEKMGFSKLFRRIESIAIHTESMRNQKIEELLSDVRSVHQFDLLIVGNGNITNDQIVDLVHDLTIRRLNVNLNTLRVTNGQWLAKTHLEQLVLNGYLFENKDLAMLPTSIKSFEFYCAPASDIDATSFARFPALKAMKFYTDTPLRLKEQLRDANKYDLNFHGR